MAMTPEEKRAREAEYRAANRDKRIAYSVSYYHSNKDTFKEKAAIKYIKNREHLLAYSNAYNEEHREEKRVYARERYANNKEKLREISKKYKDNNKDKIKKYKAEYRSANKEKIRMQRVSYNESHQEEIRLRVMQYRASKKVGGGKLSKGIIQKLWKLQKGKCAACKADLKKAGFHLDHIVPLKPRNGGIPGKHEDTNMQLLCPTCNVKKHNKDPIQFMQEMGYLL